MADSPTTKPELLDLIRFRWDVLQELLGQLDEAAMERPLGDGWSAKVHLGHVAAWEKSALALLRGQHRGDAMGLPRPLWDEHNSGNDETWAASGDAVNAALAANTEGLSLAEVRADSDATHAEMVAQLKSMSQEDLEKPYSHYQPDDEPYEGRPVAGWVHGNTWEHYNEHIGWLEQGLREANS